MNVIVKTMKKENVGEFLQYVLTFLTFLLFP